MKSTLRSRHMHIGLLKSLTFLGIPILLLVSCDPQAEMTTFDKEEVRQAVKQTLENYFKDIAKDGLTAEFKYLDNSPDFFWVPPGYSSPLSYDSVRAILTQNASNFSKKYLLLGAASTLSAFGGNHQLHWNSQRLRDRHYRP